MRRRKFIQAIAAVPAAGIPISLLGQAPGTQPQRDGVASAPFRQAPQGAQAVPVLKTAFYPEDATAPVPGFFTKLQLSALRRLSELYVPATDGKPGAADCGTAEFLDFYMSVSDEPRQQFYRSGLDDLNRQAEAKFHKTFADLSDAEAGSILKPMFKPQGQLDGSLELGPFVNRAYKEILTVTENSPTWVASQKAAGVTFGLTTQYWDRVDPTIHRKVDIPNDPKVSLPTARNSNTRIG